MEITEVRIKLMENSQERLQAFCSITLDSCFVIRDLKIIQGTKGSFVAMPSRKLTDRCPRCHSKNHLRANYCNHCGTQLDEERALKDSDGRAKLYADIAHPIKSECRDLIQRVVLEAYEEETIRAQDPNYVCRYDDYGENDYEPYENASATTLPAAPAVAPSEAALGEVVAGERVHRLETGSNGHPQRPHHAAGTTREVDSAEPSGQRVPAGAVSGKNTGGNNSTEEDESFGAGIL